VFTSQRRIRVALVGCVATVALLAGCSSGVGNAVSTGSSAKPVAVKKLAYIVKSGNDPYFVNENKGIQSESKTLGITTTMTDVQADTNAAISAVDTSIGQGAQGIAIVVPDQKIGPAVISKAKAAGVPLIAINDPIKDASGKAAPFIGFDATAIGTQVGTSLADLLTKGGVKAGADVKIASVENQKTPVCMARNEAAQAALFKAFPGLSESNILHVPYNNDLNSAIDAMNTVVTANASVKTWITYSCNDGGVLGAWRALASHGVSASNVYGVGIGGEYACQEFGKAEPSGFRAAYYTNSARNGVAAVKILHDFLANGTAIPARTILEGEFVDPSNYKKTIGC
jgi:L-arabinose transport system substrate-binding protein